MKGDRVRHPRVAGPAAGRLIPVCSVRHRRVTSLPCHLPPAVRTALQSVPPAVHV